MNSKVTDENKEKAKKAFNDFGDQVTKAAASAADYVSSKIDDEDKKKAKDTFTKFTNKAKDMGFNKENFDKAKGAAFNAAGDLSKAAGETLLNASKKLKDSQKKEEKASVDDVIDVEVNEAEAKTEEEAEKEEPKAEEEAKPTDESTEDDQNKDQDA